MPDPQGVIHRKLSCSNHVVWIPCKYREGWPAARQAVSLDKGPDSPADTGVTWSENIITRKPPILALTVSKTRHWFQPIFAGATEQVLTCEAQRATFGDDSIVST